MALQMTNLVIVVSEVGQQFQGLPGALFRNHNALHVRVAYLKSGQETSEVSTMYEHRNVVCLKKRPYDNRFGLRLW